MTFICRPAEGLQLVVGDRLETMFSHQPKAFQLRSTYPISLSLMVDLKRFHSLGVQGVVGCEYLAQISFHDLLLSP